jgi:two-component system sensor histidine kinase VicK
MFVFNKELQVINASDAALNYCGMESSQVFGKPIFDSLSLEFRNDFTLDSWIQDCQENRVTHTGYWERVRVRVNGTDDIRQCDMAAFYNRENPSGTEFIVTLFDRTAQYNQDDESMGFVALAVHELRTPLTVLRGYIEVFNDELGDQLNDEHRDFMYKMEASANQLTSFVHNILNVARVDANQLQLQLTEENWGEVLHKGAENMELRAKVRGKVIEYDIAKDLPLAAVDSVSAYEVINNLLDNAIKYSPDEESKRIVVRSILNKEGFIETTIQDFGVGIPSSVLPNLFEKFYRNHRTRAQIGGTGLGLYLCKCIVSAHGGRIWANSKEGEGSTFGFTILPYNKLSKEQKAGDTSITRQANGWIKNHSYYRR